MWNYEITLDWSDGHDVLDRGEGFETFKQARDEMNDVIARYNKEKKQGIVIDAPEPNEFNGQIYKLTNGVWEPFFGEAPMAEPQLKRKDPEPTTPEEPAVDDIIPEPIAINWRKFDGDSLEASFKASTGPYGGMNCYLNRKGARSVKVTMPFCRVEYEPSVWDESKQAKWGKKEANGEVKKLDPNRKKDKASLTLRVPEGWANWFRAYKLYVARKIFEQKDFIFAKDPDRKNVPNAEGLLLLFEAGVKQQANGDYHFKLDMKTDVGAEQVPLPLFDALTEKPLPADRVLGRGSEAAAVVDLSYAFIGQKIKIYARPTEMYVRTVVAPEHDGTRHRPQFDDDE